MLIEWILVEQDLVVKDCKEMLLKLNIPLFEEEDEETDL